MDSKKALLILNVGSPNSPEPKDVGNYLVEFLMDPYILPLPFLIRWILVNWIIVPRRKFSSAEKYHKIWTEQGSPLIYLTRQFSEKLQKVVDIKVHMAMCCGHPSVFEVLEQLKKAGCEELILAPVYPQYAKATTYATFAKVEGELKKLKWQPRIKKLEPFYQAAGFIDSFVEKIKSKDLSRFDHVLFSFHGLPVSQVRDENNSAAYPRHCKETAELLAQKLNLTSEKWSYSYQSRLGPTDWIEPYTDATISELSRRGVKNLLLVCPSFVTDCLETLEEIGMGAREDFLRQGGRNFELAECPNSSELWVRGFKQILDDQGLLK